MSRTLAEKKYNRNARRAASAYGSVEWYTPPWLLAAIEAFLGTGPGYLDPCPARNGHPLEVNGLAISWAGCRVFCNPPYGRAIAPWITKAMTEEVEEIILLLPAYTETKWFRPLFAHSLCFIRGRVSYWRPDKGELTNAPHASVLVYRGARHQDFADHFAEIGATLVHLWGRGSEGDLWTQEAS